MASTPVTEPDRPSRAAEQASIRSAQAGHRDPGITGAAVDGDAPEASPGEPTGQAEPAERTEPATELRRRLHERWSRIPHQGRGQRRWLLGTGGMVIVALGFALWLGAMAVGGKAPTGPSDPVGGAPEPAFVPYQDPQGRFSLSYPTGWQQEPSSASEAALLLRTGPASQSSMLVRIVPLDEPVKPEQLADARKFTDGLVQASDVKVLVVRQITLNGVPGFYYLYTFGRPGSDRFGLHAHYFLFSGPTMHVLVFQALPDTEFVDLAPAFDAIARSYRV